ncbi:SMI1/KNR4 family protein [Actinacidiphila acididurans]|uniref:SMI1/KNR4 family protein n=1 Tax=Actinacidiphila acididurans TaxID=2784346 RepID=A0ABS2U4U9_9ACTN|nr:SMI1/KNR4 family protein [Actinacidiphila acididurans]MBM9510658.1 SMI1/KNR4 family protein [Actinacidiphila acididurans]
METERVDPDDLAFLRGAFGVDGGGQPALGWDAVRAFEAEHGIVLPEPYRTFVAEVTDGSPSGPPEYGLVPLATLPADWGNGRPERVLNRPFPLTETWVWEDDPRPGDVLDPLLDEVFDHGSVVLGTEGCGMYWHLIVNGPQRGHIWLVTGEGAMPFGSDPGSLDGEPGFLGWVRHWADGKSWFDMR